MLNSNQNAGGPPNLVASLTSIDRGMNPAPKVMQVDHPNAEKARAHQTGLTTLLSGPICNTYRKDTCRPHQKEEDS